MTTLDDVEDFAGDIRRLATWFDSHGVSVDTCLMKVGEESGEVFDAYIGWQGTNPRKGVYKTKADVFKELGDVAVTALMAIEMLQDLDKDATPFSTVKFLMEHAEFLRSRVDA